MEQEMKVSSDTIRRLRNARGWTQEQLSTAAGLSLRTVQRVEGEGVASRETKVCLAATFGVDLDALSDVPAPAGGMSAAASVVLAGYKAAALVSILALGLFAFGLAAPEVLPGGLVGAALILAVAAALYAGAGWFFQRAAAGQSTPARRAVQRGIVFLAIFWLFAAVSGPGRAYLLLFAQVALAAGVIYVLAAKYFFRGAQIRPLTQR